MNICHTGLQKQDKRLYLKFDRLNYEVIIIVYIALYESCNFTHTLKWAYRVNWQSHY